MSKCCIKLFSLGHILNNSSHFIFHKYLLLKENIILIKNRKKLNLSYTPKQTPVANHAATILFVGNNFFIIKYY